MTSAVTYKITYVIYYISANSNHLTLFKVLYTIFWKKLMLVVYLIYEIMYIFLSLAIVQGVCKQWLPGGRTPLYGLYGDVPLDRVWFLSSLS